MSVNDLQYPEEGASCPNCIDGKFKFSKSENCSCHLTPPCSSCMEVYLYCPNCGFNEEDFQEIEENKK